jgi:hypothetical protein
VDLPVREPAVAFRSGVRRRDGATGANPTAAADRALYAVKLTGNDAVAVAMATPATHASASAPAVVRGCPLPRPRSDSRGRAIGGKAGRIDEESRSCPARCGR